MTSTTTTDPATPTNNLGRLMGENASLKSEVSTLQSTVSTLDSKVSTLNSKVSTLDSEKSTLSSKNSILNSEVSALNQQMEQLFRQIVAGSASNTPFSVTNYHPAMLLKRISEGDTLEDSSVQRHKKSTLLFLDISGYTKLAESMGKEGPAGTEKLSKALSIFFEKAIKLINDNGGDVIKFCGDALLTVFPSDGELIPLGEGDGEGDNEGVVVSRPALSASDDSKRHTEAIARVRLTMQCALEAMAALSPYVISETLTLDLKIMVGFGNDILPRCRVVVEG